MVSIESDDQICVVCDTSAGDDVNYLNTTMKFLISKCGHRFCDQCIKREFSNRREIPCTACGKAVKKSQLQDKSIEELAYHKEMLVRKKVMKDYNKTEEDFDTLDEFNNYLEDCENIVYGTEEEKAKAQKIWKDYRNENAILIATNDAKKAEEERRILQMISETQRGLEEKRLLQQKEDSQYDLDKKKYQAELMEVALGERDASDVHELRATTTAIPIDQPVTAEMQAAIMGFQQGMIGGFQPQPVVGGKKGPKFGTAELKQHRKIQQKAGGYDPQTSFKRNKDEAWSGILYKYLL